MASSRKSLFQRLPEIYHIKDAEQSPPHQLRAYLDIMDEINAAMADNIEALYHDFFIESCDDWVIPYIADLLGVSHLSGDPHDLRADIAHTTRHRRRKGTLGAIESLTFSLTGWAAHAVELRERIHWNQHLNHQRPDAGGAPPIPRAIHRAGNINGSVRGGTLNLRDPAQLSFFNGPFDPFAHLIDIKPTQTGRQSYNLPNLAIYLWRLQDYTLPVIKADISLIPGEDIVAIAADSPTAASTGVRLDVHPLRQPMVLFNTHRYDPGAEPLNLTSPDAVPGPMPRARLSDNTVSGNSAAYISLLYYQTSPPAAPGEDRTGLSIHLPDTLMREWTIRGANLCAWENGLRPSLQQNEIVIDPEHGRILFGPGGADAVSDANSIAQNVYLSPTLAFSGSSQGTVGALPITRNNAPAGTLQISFERDENNNPAADGSALTRTLANLQNITRARIIEIQDSRTYTLDIDAIAGRGEEGDRRFLNLGRSFTLRAAAGQRPIILLTRPLAFRPADISGPEASGMMENLDVTLEGLYLSQAPDSTEFLTDTPLIQQVALNALNIINCTLDPGNHRALDGSRQPARPAFSLASDFSLSDADELDAFEQIPHIYLRRSICGPAAMGENYRLTLEDSIIDAQDDAQTDPAPLAVHAPIDPENNWGPDLRINGMTCFGRMRVSRATGQGGIWTDRLEVHDNQQGCIKFSYFSGNGDRLPQHQASVSGTSSRLIFESRTFARADYAQLSLNSDPEILEQGPDRDAMGAFGFLLNTHKWKNINIRYREFMPIGIKPILIPVTQDHHAGDTP